MIAADELYQRFRHQIHEGAKFGIVGIIGIVVTNIVFAPLRKSGVGVIAAVTIATIMATVVTFLGNRYWSFRHREGSGTSKEGVTFFLLNGIGMLIQYAVLGINNHVLGLTGAVENQIVLNIGIGIGTLFRFWSYRKFIWVSAEEKLRQLSRGRHRRGRPTDGPDPRLAAYPPAAGQVPAGQRPSGQYPSGQYPSGGNGFAGASGGYPASSAFASAPPAGYPAATDPASTPATSYPAAGTPPTGYLAGNGGAPIRTGNDLPTGYGTAARAGYDLPGHRAAGNGSAPGPGVSANGQGIPPDAAVPRPDGANRGRGGGTETPGMTGARYRSGSWADGTGPVGAPVPEPEPARPADRQAPGFLANAGLGHRDSIWDTAVGWGGSPVEPAMPSRGGPGAGQGGSGSFSFGQPAAESAARPSPSFHPAGDRRDDAQADPPGRPVASRPPFGPDSAERG